LPLRYGPLVYQSAENRGRYAQVPNMSMNGGIVIHTFMSAVFTMEDLAPCSVQWFPERFQPIAGCFSLKLEFAMNLNSMFTGLENIPRHD